MKLLMKLLKLVYKLFKSKAKSSNRNKTDYSNPEYSLKYVEDLPEYSFIEDRVVYVVGENENYWVVAFKCPCGCKDFVQLNLLSEGRNVWKLYIHENERFSIYPSIDRSISCKSHFTLTNGKVIWWTANY